jgi:hypothetical protein
MSRLSKAIKSATGLTLADFCEKELNTKYNAFAMRLMGNKLYAAEVFYIVYRTGKTCEYLFNKSWQELLINKVGNVSETVVDHLRALTPQQQAHVQGLLGIPGATIPSPPAEITITPTPAHEPPAEEPEDPFKGLFVNTY